MSELRIGTSGWVYKDWTGVLYRPKLPPGQWLPIFAERFSTVEINRSYYRLPERSVFEGWRQQTPPDFLFAVKASRYLTHMKKLKDPEQPLELLIGNARGLDEKLGPLLFQFPRQWAINLERLDNFLFALRSYPGLRFTFEFRHKSWLVPAVYQRLERAGCALCLPVGWGIPLDLQVTAPWSYIRMHGGETTNAFSEQELAAWAARIDDFLARGIDVYAYFNNDAHGDAVDDAQRLKAMVSGRASDLAAAG
jgi:uncharacterized protein YecE (DUF72 family)